MAKFYQITHLHTLPLSNTFSLTLFFSPEQQCLISFYFFYWITPHRRKNLDIKFKESWNMIPVKLKCKEYNTVQWRFILNSPWRLQFYQYKKLIYLDRFNLWTTESPNQIRTEIRELKCKEYNTVQWGVILKKPLRPSILSM